MRLASLRVPPRALPAGFALGAMLLQQRARLPDAASVAWMLVAAMILVVGAAVAPRGRCGGAPAVFLALAGGILAGFGYAGLRAEARLADALPAAWENRDLRVRGVVDGLPQRSADGVRFAFAVEAVLTPGAVVPSRLSLAWFAPRVAGASGFSPRVVVTPAPDVHAGERWALTVRLKRPHGNVNPDGFDLEGWMLERNLRAAGYVRDGDPAIREAAFAGRAGDWIGRARETIRARMAAVTGRGESGAVLTALAIGDQSSISDAQWQVFNRTGVTHLVSISGLHVTVFAALAGLVAYAALRRSARLALRIPARKLAVLAGVGAAWGYVLLAGAEIPAMRTFLMLAIAAAGMWLNRFASAASIWLWSLAVVVVADPLAPLSPGCWLSFGAVGLLVYACAARLGSSRGSSIPVRAARVLREAVRAQWVVTLGLVPGTLAWFQQVSLVSPLANALAIPVVTFGVVPLALAGMVIPLDLPWILAQRVLDALLAALAWLASLPHAAWVSHAPAGWAVVAAVAGALWSLAPRGIPGRALGFVLMLPMVVIAPRAPGHGEFSAVVLDVGQGLSVSIRTARHALLFDTGPRYRSGDAGSRIVVPWLRAAGIRRIDRLIVSHADADHSGGAASVLAAVPVTLVESSFDDRVLASNGRRVRCVAGERWEWEGVAFEILHPGAEAYDDPSRRPNDLSCVLAVTSGAGRILLTGDIEARAERELVARGLGPLRADVVIVPHHGSRTSSTAPFVDAVAPRAAAVTAGYLNAFGHPRPEVLARYRQSGAVLLRTDLDGALTLDFERVGGLAIATERERRRRYWYGGRSRNPRAACREASARRAAWRRSLRRRRARSSPPSRRPADAGMASPARNRDRGSRSRAGRPSRSASRRPESSSGRAPEARTRNRRSRL